MTREQLLEKFDTATGWSMINPIEVLNAARKEFIDLIVKMEELAEINSDKKCGNCKHKDGESGSLTHCSYFEQFMPTEIGKCDIWESKNARII